MNKIKKPPRAAFVIMTLSETEKLRLDAAAEAEGFENTSMWMRWVLRHVSGKGQNTKLLPDTNTEKRGRTYNFRVTDAEVKAIKAAALRQKMPKHSQWMRAVLLTQAAAVLTEVTASEGVRRKAKKK